MTKLNDKQISEIKQLIKTHTQRELSIKYNVTIGAIIYHTNERSKKMRIEYAKKYFKNLPDEKKKEIYDKRKEYQKNYMKRRKDE